MCCACVGGRPSEQKVRWRAALRAAGSADREEEGAQMQVGVQFFSLLLCSHYKGIEVRACSG